MLYKENEIVANAQRVLKRLRLDAGNITQGKVAEAIIMSASTYNRVENGNQKLYLLDMVRIANFYNISMSQLGEMIQHSPAELSLIKQLQLKLDESLKEVAYLKDRLENFKQKA